MTRQEFETALDARKVQVMGRTGKWYDIRRNGATQTWKTRPDEFSTPVKVGFRECFRVTERELSLNAADYRIRP